MWGGLVVGAIARGQQKRRAEDGLSAFAYDC